MRIQKIEYRETNSFSQLILDYLADSPNLRSFYPYRPSLEGLRESVDKLEFDDTQREQLAGSIAEQYVDFGIDDHLTQSQLNKLRQPETYCVVTAHQPCLFTGPLYFVIKIAAAINLANKLNNQFPEKHFIPVYWMGGEDHDFEEISHARIFSNDVQWEHPKPSGAVGRLDISGLEDSINQLKQLLGESEIDVKLEQLITNAYLGSETYGQATLRLVHALFEGTGLLMINQDHPVHKASMKAVFEEELFGTSSNEVISKRMDDLETAGYHNQAHSRPINLFWLEGNIRKRIEKDGENFKLADDSRSISASEMRQTIANHPEKFSPNVILRPLYQQKLLPAPVFIGGGSEVAYWMQLTPLFERWKVHFPLLLLRNSLLYIDSTSTKKMNQLELVISDLFKDTDTLLREYVEQNSRESLSLGKEKGEIVKVFKQAAEKVAEVDPALKKSVMAEEQKVLKSLSNLEDKVVRAQKKRFDVELNKIRGVKDRLFPNGHLQERKDNFIPIYLRSRGTFISDLIEHMNPLDLHFTVIQEA